MPIKPITLIFGPNSSGKSSIFQSLLMLKQTIEDTTDTGQVLLPKGSLVDLGSYKEFIFSHDSKRKFSISIRIKNNKRVFDKLLPQHKNVILFAN
ncbi:MAG: ATP-binding protein [Deltaproteobacteria bacterium]|nr:ATP-binding protein [Deltaproteobacteria bacterium]